MDNGLYLYCNWDYIFISPPLIIKEAEIDQMVAGIDKALDYSDSLVKK
jgi:adenosylmethionine-8-amino-7-oxononanoate aminotransferase